MSDPGWYFLHCSAVLSSHLSLVLGSRFDHAAEATMPILLNLVPNSAKVIATSGVAVIRLILRVRGSFTSMMSVFIGILWKHKLGRWSLTLKQVRGSHSSIIFKLLQPWEINAASCPDYLCSQNWICSRGSNIMMLVQSCSWKDFTDKCDLILQITFHVKKKRRS